MTGPSPLAPALPAAGLGRRESAGARWLTGPGLLVFLLAALAAYEGFLLLTVFGPTSGGAVGEFVRDFQRWCYRGDPRTGGVSWMAVSVMMGEPLFVAGVAVLLWRDALRALRAGATWRRHAGAAAAGLGLVAFAVAGLAWYARADRKRSFSRAASKVTTTPPLPSGPTPPSVTGVSRAVSCRTPVPSTFITHRLRQPSRSLSKTMAAPSCVKAERPSSAGLAVRRSAAPPPAGTRHRSPRQLNTTVRPSGLTDGYRGRSTLPAAAGAAPVPGPSSGRGMAFALLTPQAGSVHRRKAAVPAMRRLEVMRLDPNVWAGDGAFRHQGT